MRTNLTVDDREYWVSLMCAKGTTMTDAEWAEIQQIRDSFYGCKVIDVVLEWMRRHPEGEVT